MITLNDIQALGPCWSKERLAARVPAEGVSYRDIASSKDVTAADRRWLLTQLAARTKEGRTLLLLWATECAKAVLCNIPEGHLLEAAKTAITAAVACAANSTEETRTAAESAATAARSAATAAATAARSAARSAAWSARSAATAAESAAWSAAESAAESAESAARSAATAATAAARSAAEEQQLINLATALEAL